MPRRNDDLDDLLNRLGRRSAHLSIDDVAAVVGDALKNQRQQILGHVERKFELERVKNSAKSDDARAHNFHARLVAIESELRQLKRERSR